MDNGFRMTNRQNKKPLKVMIIEDEQDILLLYKDYLISRGHNVLVTATSALEIISDYEKILPDITILDYKLPDNRNGIEAAVKIFTTYPSTAILIVTAYDTVKEEVLKQSIFEGKRFAILFKPIKLARLENAIYDILESK
jgi:DNA-binding NtrC family response regulator